MDAVVDRIENDIIVLEFSDVARAELPKKLMPEAKEGDVITFYINSEKTEKRKAELDERVKRLWKD